MLSICNVVFPDQLLIPALVKFKKMNLEIDRIWAGAYSSFASTKSGKVYVFGLNNYKQLGKNFYLTLSLTLSNNTYCQM